MVIAIFHFIFAALGLCGVVATAFTKQLNDLMTSGQGPGVELQRRVQQAMENAPGYNAVLAGMVAVGSVNVALLLVSGIGLLNMRPWARVLSIVYAVLQILTALFWMGYFLSVLQPATAPLWDEMVRGNPGAAAGAKIGAVVGGLIGSCFPLIYPIAVLIVMLLPSVGKAFRRAAERGDDYDREEEEDRPDYYDDRYER
jgi:hypothetical protein